MNKNQHFETVSPIVEGYGLQLQEVIAVQETERGTEYAVLVSLDRGCRREVLIQHQWLGGVFWLWEADYENYIGDCREISAIVEQYRRIPPAQRTSDDARSVAMMLCDINPQLASAILSTYPKAD